MFASLTLKIFLGDEGDSAGERGPFSAFLLSIFWLESARSSRGRRPTGRLLFSLAAANVRGVRTLTELVTGVVCGARGCFGLSWYTCTSDWTGLALVFLGETIFLGEVTFLGVDSSSWIRLTAGEGGTLGCPSASTLTESIWMAGVGIG